MQVRTLAIASCLFLMASPLHLNAQTRSSVASFGGSGAAAGDSDMGLDVAPPTAGEDYFSGATESYASGPLSFAPNMIGDLLGSPCIPFEDIYAVGCVASPGGGPIVGRVKLSDNNSPLPKDRVFLDYSYFQNVPLTLDGMGVSRLTPGIEKTFWGGTASLEVRVPLLSTLSSDVTFNGVGDVVGDTYNGELGNLALFAKVLLWRCETIAVSGGLGVYVPTADDVVAYADGFVDPVAVFENESVHLSPYFAALYTPNDCLFLQAFLQVDMDVNGNPVTSIDAGTPTLVGRWTDQTLLYADIAGGAWLYRDPCSRRGLTGLAGIVELHYNQSVSDYDAIDSGDTQIGGALPGVDTNLSIVNLTAGATAVFGQQTTLTLGYGVPLSNDRVFDGEARIFFNRYF